AAAAPFRDLVHLDPRRLLALCRWPRSSEIKKRSRRSRKVEDRYWTDWAASRPLLYLPKTLLTPHPRHFHSTPHPLSQRRLRRLGHPLLHPCLPQRPSRSSASSLLMRLPLPPTHQPAMRPHLPSLQRTRARG